MIQETQPDAPEDAPTDDELEVEAPNEGAPGHNPSDADDGEDAGQQA